MVVTLGVLCLLALSFFAIFTAQKNALALKLKYPKQNCKDYVEEYKANRQLWQHDAMNEYMVNTEIEENDGQAIYTGPM